MQKYKVYMKQLVMKLEVLCQRLSNVGTKLYFSDRQLLQGLSIKGCALETQFAITMNVAICCNIVQQFPTSCNVVQLFGNLLHVLATFFIFLKLFSNCKLCFQCTSFY